MQHSVVRSGRSPGRAPPVPILHVRNVPPRLYADLKRLARENRRSLTAEVIAALGRSVEAEARRADQRRILEELIALGDSVGPLGTDSTAWIREDRDRDG